MLEEKIQELQELGKKFSHPNPKEIDGAFELCSPIPFADPKITVRNTNSWQLVIHNQSFKGCPHKTLEGNSPIEVIQMAIDLYKKTLTPQ